MRKTQAVSGVLCGLTVAAWTAVQSSGQHPPWLDQVTVAIVGMALAQSAFVTKEKSPPTEDDVAVTRSSDRSRSTDAESDTPPVTAPDAKGTFYCQAGDHIVDHVVWLETITLGCRPCMEKLGLSIATEDWTPRLWTVGPDGIKRAEPIRKPKKPAPKKATPPPASRNPFSETSRRRRGSPRQYVAEHQDWTCSECHNTDDKMDGYYNTERGYVCKRCTGNGTKLGQDKLTDLQRSRRERRLREEKIIQRQSADLYIDVPPPHTGTITRTGTGSSVQVAEVLPEQHIRVTGTGGSVFVTGDVGEGAVISCTGTGASVTVRGHIHEGVTIECVGTGASVTYNTREEYSQVQAHGTGARVKGTVKNRRDDNSVRQAREQLAKKYGLDPQFAQFDEWMAAKEAMAPAVEQLSKKLYVCTCVRCGKYDVDNPVLGGASALDASYLCGGCIHTKSSLSKLGGIPLDRIGDLARLTELSVVDTPSDLPKKGREGDHVYVKSVDWLFTWLHGAWIRVAMPSRNHSFREIETPAHKHIWQELWGIEGRFCVQCGERS